MRILVAAERLGRTGGMERYLNVVLPALVERGATVRVVARRIDAVPAGIEAEQLDWSDEHERPSGAAGAAAVHVVDTFKPDVTVAHNVMDGCVVAAMRVAPRFVYHVHDHRPFCPNGDRVFPRSSRICTERLGRACAVHSLTDGCVYGPRRRTLSLIHRRERLRDAIATADAVVVASRYVAERTEQNAVPRERIVEIPLPLPNDAYVPVVAPPSSRAIVFAGRIVPQKGLAVLVRAVGRIAPARRPPIVAFGDGPALEAARAEAASLGVQLDARGIAPAETVRTAIDGGALVALPSLWAEPFGYVGIEAFARGRPVVAFDVGGVRAWLDDGTNGVAVRAGDEAALGDALDALLHDEARRTTLAQRARTDAERYRVAPITEALLGAYRG
jgi:glycosyltransferase involved in cell wall biosynthesis